MIKIFHFERRKKQEAEGYDSNRNSNANLRETDVIAFTNIGKVRQANEDDWGVAKTPNGYLFTVCDGMGGHVGGQEASRIAVESIIEYLKKEKYPNPLQALNQALQFANMQILGFANTHSELKGMGTTSCVLLLQSNEAYIAHVGDSRIYLYLSKEKELHRITKDHSYVQTLVDAGEISDEEAESHPNKNRILKALGIKSDLQPAFNYQNKPILPKNGDVFLICSDGLSGMINDDTIKSVLSNNDSLEQKGEMLINLALQNGGLDNITVELIQISNSLHKKSAFTSFNPKNNPKSSVSKSGKGKKIFIGILITLLCLLGAGVAYYFIQKKTIEDEIENLRTNIDQAKENYNKLKHQVDSLQSKNTENIQNTKDAKKAKDHFDNSNEPNDHADKTYLDMKKISDKSEKDLQDLEILWGKAKHKRDSLKSTFEKDSIKIINSSKIFKIFKNESNNHR